MRVISKFRDYYDSVAKHGQDMAVVYNRREMTFSVRDKTVPQLIVELDTIIREAANVERNRWRTENEPKLYDWLGRPDSFYSAEYTSIDAAGKKWSYNTHTVYVVFCGVVYKGICVAKRPHRESLIYATYEYFYDAHAIVSYLRKEGIDMNTVKSQGSIFSRSGPALPLPEWYRASFARTRTSAEQREWLIANKVTVAVRDGHDLIINPQLDKYQFYKKFPTTAAFQALDVWISGTLSYPHDIPLEIDDKYKIQEHGFDKWSFRRMPTKKRK